MSCETSTPDCSTSRGISAGRPDQRDAHAAARERDHVRAGDARVQDVADDRDVQALEPADRLADRVEVEQRLRRVLVLAVARVDDRRARCAA